MTVLTEALATVNIQSGCRRVRWYARESSTAAERVAKILQQARDDDRLTQIRRIARSHVRDYGTANGVIERKKRLEELRAAGFDPASPDGQVYSQFVEEERVRTYG